MCARDIDLIFPRYIGPKPIYRQYIVDIISNITDIGYIEDILTNISDIFIPDCYGGFKHFLHLGLRLGPS